MFSVASFFGWQRSLGAVLLVEGRNQDDNGSRGSVLQERRSSTLECSRVVERDTLPTSKHFVMIRAGRVHVW